MRSLWYDCLNFPLLFLNSSHTSVRYCMHFVRIALNDFNSVIQMMLCFPVCFTGWSRRPRRHISFIFWGSHADRVCLRWICYKNITAIVWMQRRVWQKESKFWIGSVTLWSDLLLLNCVLPCVHVPGFCREAFYGQGVQLFHSNLFVLIQRTRGWMHAHMGIGQDDYERCRLQASLFKGRTRQDV